MCELMGLSFARPRSAEDSLRAFGARSAGSPDGWGLAWYPDWAAALVKEPIPWAESRLARFLVGDPGLRSTLYLAHMREKTTGDTPAYADTHPFLRERDGRDYSFGHNGTLRGPIHDLPTGRYHPLGVTDSERAFCHLLDEFDRREGHLDDPDAWEWLHFCLARLNRLGTINMLLSDGLRLFAYHDLAGWKGLSFRTLDPEEGAMVSTYPLGGVGWQPFQVGELLVFEAGVACFSSNRDVSKV